MGWKLGGDQQVDEQTRMFVGGEYHVSVIKPSSAGFINELLFSSCVRLSTMDGKFSKMLMLL